MSNQNQQHDASIDENKESATLQSLLSEQESQEQAFYNYSTQNDQPNPLNHSFQEDLSAFVEYFKAPIKQGQQKDQFSKNIQNKKLKKTQYKKKVKRIKEFQYEEDIRLLNLVHEHGRQFSRIVKQFPKRTVSMLKNRYYKNLRYRWEELLGIEYTENEDEQKTLNQVEVSYTDNQFVNQQDLINMIPNSYSCPIICGMLSQFITKMDQFLKTQF
ncbi:unnamed protein product [Paramecium sonneborni]|uniref:HTH myb-type domain-containing protein n=1 Tax=Paramecium sonneborni TaxID=65129 RepID=A0A8S1KFF0_9CILI|nr:unnamed protein product [Paramecium sonneborni]